MDQVDEPDRRQLAFTRKLYILWIVAGLVLGLALCYGLALAFRARDPKPVLLGRVEDFPNDSVTLKFVNAEFFDPATQKDFTTLSLQIARDPSGNFTVFFARSTDPRWGALSPRQCVVTWLPESQRFDSCDGSEWNRDGKYLQGAAPRDLDRFPPEIKNGDLGIQLDLIEGAAHP